MASQVDDRGYNQGYQWTPTQQVRMERRAKAIIAAANPRPGDRILELGCGTGELAHLLSMQTQAVVTGVDLCAPFIAKANESYANRTLSYVAADLASSEDRRALGDGWQSLVGNGILHHLYHDIENALASMFGMLRPGGRFVFWEPNIFNPYVFAIFRFRSLRKIAKLEPDEMAFTPRWISDHLLSAGFTRINVSFRDFLVPIVPMVLTPLVARAGAVAESIPGVNRLAQSLFIEATKPDPS